MFAHLKGRFAPEAAVQPGVLFLRPDNKSQKATRALHRMVFARQRFRLGAHSVRVEVPVQGVMELPTVAANEPALLLHAALATFSGPACSMARI